MVMLFTHLVVFFLTIFWITVPIHISIVRLLIWRRCLHKDPIIVNKLILLTISATDSTSFNIALVVKKHLIGEISQVTV